MTSCASGMLACMTLRTQSQNRARSLRCVASFCAITTDCNHRRPAPSNVRTVARGDPTSGDSLAGTSCMSFRLISLPDWISAFPSNAATWRSSSRPATYRSRKSQRFASGPKRRKHQRSQQRHIGARPSSSRPFPRPQGEGLFPKVRRGTLAISPPRGHSRLADRPRSRVSTQARPRAVPWALPEAVIQKMANGPRPWDRDGEAAT
jgi:hypothetical protein